MAFRPPDDRLDAGDQLIAVKGLGHVVIGPETESAQLAFGIVRAGQDQDRRVDPRHADLAQHLHPVHVRQIQIQQDQIIVVELGQIDALFAHVGAIDVVTGMGQHHFNAARRGRIILHKKDSHVISPC